MDQSNPSHEERQALDHLFSVTYEELRRLASTVRRGVPMATLSATTVVNEVWLKLARSPAFSGISEEHFKRIAARAMRQVLVSAARRRGALKRGGDGVLMITLDDFAGPATKTEDQVLALDTALEELSRMHPRQAMMVESRFFGGLEMTEIATLLNVSEATLLRDWRAARAWLARELRKGD